VMFQPHRFSRTRQFKTEFAAALAAADRLHLIDVYGAGEAPLAGGTTADLYAELQRQAPAVPVAYFPGDPERLLAGALDDTRPGDLLVFVGAGDIDQRARDWRRQYERRQEVARQWDAVAGALSQRLSPEARVRREEPLAPKTTMRVGGAARIYVEPADAVDLEAVVRLAREQKLPLHVLGRGSNLLVPDAGVDGIVVSLRLPRWETFEPLPDGRVRVGAGLRLKNLCGLATRSGLGGFEFLEGIPGNLGGALRMNAGAMGGWMYDVVDEVELVTLDGERRRLRRDELHVDYRHCAELEAAIAVSALLRPAASRVAADISRQIDSYRDQRQKSQPREPSAGCIFKNPPNDSAGRLIDACGLKGERIGDAEVSGVHGNFIVNRGHATSADVLALVRRVRGRVEQQTGIRLQPEVLLFGAKWEDVL
jgi:UDP-N-acetylmuramate--alanine ligase